MSSLPPQIQTAPRFRQLPVGLGMTAVVLGVIGFIFVWFPVLGVPVSALGLIFGVIGLLVPRFRFGVTLRWTLLGVAVCAAALGAGVAINWARLGYLHDPNPPRLWQQPPDRPDTPPAEH
jgi:hypothetical protein